MMLKETLCKCMELGKNSYLLGTDEKKSRYFKNGVFLGKNMCPFFGICIDSKISLLKTFANFPGVVHGPIQINGKSATVVNATGTECLEEVNIGSTEQG